MNKARTLQRIHTRNKISFDASSKYKEKIIGSLEIDMHSDTCGLPFCAQGNQPHFVTGKFKTPKCDKTLIFLYKPKELRNFKLFIGTLSLIKMLSKA